MTNSYISIVGTQLAAVFNPLSVLEKENIAVDKVVLMATEESRKYADRISGMIKNKEIEIKDISLISSTNEIEHNPNKQPAHIVLKDYLNKKGDLVIFNLAGGLNFQIVNCAIQTYKSQIPISYIYPEDRKCYLTKFMHDKFELAASEKIPDSLSVNDILQFHDVIYSIDNNVENLTHNKLCQLRQYPTILNNGLKNVKIGQVVYDFIFNDGFNSLVFIASVGSNNLLESARNIIAAASGRDIIPNIFHRKFIVLTDNKSQMERLEGFAKINTVIDLKNRKLSYNNDFKPIFEPVISSSNNFNISTKHHQSVELEPNRIDSEERNTVLFVVLGPDILPTLISLWSSGTDEIVFIYTPNDKTVDRYKKAIIRNASLLKEKINIKKISFFPASIIGNEILDINVDKNKKFISVISPGTKSQGYFLALLGLQSKDNVTIYSIENKQQKLFCLYSSLEKDLHHLDLNGPDPSIILKLKGEIDGEGKIIQSNDEKNQLLLSFMQCLAKDNKPIADLFSEDPATIKQSVQIECFIYTEKTGGKAELIKNSNNRKENKKYSYKLIGGEWFEKLIGYIMKQCGADDVRIRMRMKWLPETQAILEKNNPNTPIYKNDIDVVARFKNIYYAISCKATKKKDVTKFAREVQYYAHTFGRFCIPMLCYLKFRDDPANPINHNGVYVFGYNTFTNPEKMKALLKKASVDKKTK